MDAVEVKQRRISTRTVLFIIIAVSVIVRLAAAFMLGNQVINLPGTSDQISYHNLALRVLGGYGFSFGENWWPATLANTPTAHWSFLYTIYLVLVYALFGPNPLIARLIQAIIVGILQPLLVYKIGESVFNRKVGLVGAAITAVYIYFIYYAATLMTEPFYILSILSSLYLGILLSAPGEPQNHSQARDFWLAALLGLAIAVAVLLRQLYLLFLPFLFVWIWWVRHKLGGRSVVLPLALSACVLVLMILPLTLYNYGRFHRFVLVNTNAGFAFFWGNNPIYGTHFVPILSDDTGGYGSLIPKDLIGMDEASLDQALLRRGLQFVRDDPVRYIKLSISRIPVYFQFWPTGSSGLLSNFSRVASFGIFLPFMFYGLVISLIFRPWSLLNWIKSPVFLLHLFIIIYTVIHLLTWALIRYRLPVDAVLVMFAALAFVDLYERLIATRRESRALEYSKSSS
jgi:4-amino-4-deoxy-L-arabinose transferase-like glycosyltransferase